MDYDDGYPLTGVLLAVGLPETPSEEGQISMAGMDDGWRAKV